MGGQGIDKNRSNDGGNGKKRSDISPAVLEIRSQVYPNVDEDYCTGQIRYLPEHGVIDVHLRQHRPRSLAASFEYW